MKVGFIGTGNMGGALVRAAARAIPVQDIVVSDHFKEKAEAFASEYGVTAADNNTVASECDYIFLGVKPQMMEDMLSQIRDILCSRDNPPVLVTMAAGLGCDYIAGAAGGKCPVVRIMPNTPVGVGEGMILMCAGSGTVRECVDDVKAILSKAGKLDEISERLIDAASALSGCAPAFICMFAQALADGAVECGIPRAQALLYAEQTILGTAKMMLESGEHPEKLKDNVCSPGGTTIAGVHALEDCGFRSAAMNAVTAAYERTLELKKN